MLVSTIGISPFSRPTTMRNVMLEDYRHLVYTRIRDGRWFVRVDRVVGDRVDFYTEIEIPSVGAENHWNVFDKLGETLGKTICIDSPSIRRELKIDGD